LIKARNPRARAAFVRAGAEMLPWRAETFDVVICRLALPYTNNERALREMARVLRPGGVLLLKIHHFRYYLDEMWRAFVQHRGRQVVHDARVLAAGTIYCLVGRQPRNRVFGTESFQTLWLLKRELRRCGLLVKREMADSTRETPSFVVAKPAGDAGVRSPD
jgi:ubiquinone/menaquinone biosynthesis C-methylase UbiE